MGPLSEEELDELAGRMAPDVDGDLITPPEGAEDESDTEELTD